MNISRTKLDINQRSTYFSNFYKMCQYFSSRLHRFTRQNLLLDPEIYLDAVHTNNN